MRDCSNIIPLVGECMGHPAGNPPGANGTVAGGRKGSTNNHARRRGTKFRVGIEQNGTAHGETKNADPVRRCKALVKYSVGSDGVLMKIADRSGLAAISVT